MSETYNYADDYQNKCMKFVSKVAGATDDNLLLQGVMGMCGEAGEAVDIVKKICFQGHKFDNTAKEHLAKEIGDVLWYAATASKAIGCDLSYIMDMNIDKLSKRYSKGHFDAKESINRKDGDV